MGSTGSIGRQSIEVIRQDPDFRVIGLAAASSIETLRDQVRLLHPEAVCVYDEEKAEAFRTYGLPVRVLSGMDGLIELSTMEGADDVIISVVGMIGIRPTIAALEAGKRVLLANKETLVCAGHIIMPLSEKMGNEIRPIDSEHSAIWQSLAGENRARLEKILLTASGGPFRGRKREDLVNVKKEDALRHPNWSMGQKITIDSATMVNKGLEIIEAKWLFSLPAEKIEVLVHPESILHSAVVFTDGAVKGQMGLPDMKMPIEYALYAPDRRLMDPERRLDLWKLGTLHFEKPDTETFRGLALGMQAAEKGGSMPLIYNAANEEAVALFLEGRIAFLDIADRIAEAMKEHEADWLPSPGLDEILSLEKWARKLVRVSAGQRQ